MSLHNEIKSRTQRSLVRNGLQINLRHKWLPSAVVLSRCVMEHLPAVPVTARTFPMTDSVPGVDQSDREDRSED